MKIMLFGSAGQVGRVLARRLPALSDVLALTRADVELTDLQALRQVIKTYAPDCIVNAAAYTAVDTAESEPDLARLINADAPGVMANMAAELDALLIHYSTDYVFDGQKPDPYVETDATNPLGVYGASKLAGEQAIAQSGCKHLIFRTTWVIGPQGGNFARTMLRLMADKDRLTVINDQHGVPTTPALIADVTLTAIAQGNWPTGIYHLTPQGQTTWFEMAQIIQSRAAAHDMALALNDGLHPIATHDYPTPAARPLNSRLNTDKLRTVLQKDLPDWAPEFKNTVDRIIEDINAP